jgi:Na+/proline symporter
MSQQSAPTAQTSASAAAVALGIFGALWAVAGIVLTIQLWQEPPTFDDPGLVFNAPAITVLAVCLVGATAAGGASAVLAQMAKRSA